MGVFDIFKRKKRKSEPEKELEIEKKTEETEKQIDIVGKTRYKWEKDIIIEPILTEKAQALMNKNIYTFKVAYNANKSEIKKAIENIFNVKVESINIANYKKRIRGRLRIRSVRPKFKKAYVKLQKGFSISF